MNLSHQPWLSLGVKSAITVVIVMIPAVTAAGSLEPPASAFDSNGAPISTGNTSASWDKKLNSTNGDATAGRVGCDSDRFTCIWDDTAVRDNETGVVWDRTPDNPGGFNTLNALNIYCADIVIGGRKGWRYPTLEELTSLIDTSNFSPALPTQHPFAALPATASGLVWTSTRDPEFPNLTGNARWTVRMRDGKVFNLASINEAPRPWCVRSGSGAGGDF